MKKAVLFLLGLACFDLLNAQNVKLNEYFKAESVQNQKKFDKLFKNTTSRKSVSKSSTEKKSDLAGFLENTPLFWKSDDRRANLSANVSDLQNGTVNGNAIGKNIDGSGLNIIVMDGGRVFEKHRIWSECKWCSCN